MDTLSVQGEQRPGMTSEPTHNANSRNTPKQGWTKYGQVATGGAPLEGHGRVKLQAVVNKQGQIELDVSSQNLRKIPPDVFNQLRTESLKLHSNDLQLIPSAISRLHKLRALDLHENAISTLPETLTNLLHLQELDLSNNKLGSVPPMLGSFKYLRVLKLSYNQFETLPHELGDLTALRRFEAEGNKLWHLPYSFQHLQHLHHLNLSRNHFDQVPICVCQMKGLETLDMHENKLINLPPDLDHLKSLLELNLASNSFEIIPQCVMNLKTLTSLDWSHNQIQKVTSKISRLTKLRVLNVEDNQLPSLPTHLQAVEYLNVARNKIHNFSVAKMRRLVYLNASHNQLENMPLGVYNLSHIKVLKLRENLISYLSQDVVLLKKLMTLDLSNNRLTSLPHVINELEHLEVLNVKGNRIESRYRYPYTNERGKAEQGIGDHPVPLVPLGYATPNVGRRQIPNGHIVSHPNGQIAQHNLVSAEAQTWNRRVSAPPEAPMSISPAHTVIRSRTRLPKQTEIRAETPIPNGNFHTETMPRHLYLQDPGGTVTKYTQKEHFHHTRKPSRFSKFRQSLGLGKTQKNRTPKLHSTAHTGIVRERPPLNYTTSNPTVDPNTVYNTWKVRHASEIEYGAQTPDYDHEYSAEFRNGAYDDSMLVRNAIAADSKPLSVTEITYPMESAIWEPDYAQCNPTVSKAIPNGSTLGERIGNNHGYKGKSHVYAYVKDHKLEQQVAHQDGHTDIDDLLQQENDDPSTLFNHSRIPYTDDWLREERNFHKSSIRSTAVTVNDSVGDRLSLGDEDFEFQPTTVTDYRLLGVCNDLETMLSQQLLQPIISHKGIFRKSINDHGTLNTLNSMPSPHFGDHLEKTSTKPTANGIIHTPYHSKPEILDTSIHYITRAPPGGTSRTKPDVFSVPSSGGLFRSSVDENVSVYFPGNALDTPLTVTMQLEKVSPFTLADVKSSHKELSNLLSVGEIVRFTVSREVDLDAQVTITIPAPPVEHTGRLHLLTLLDDNTCVPCESPYRQHNGYISLQAWHFSGKGAVLTKSKSHYKACKAMEAFLQHLYI